MKEIYICQKAQRAMGEIEKVIIGKSRIIRQVMTAIIASGHILIEDIPGVGKTTLALAFSKVLGLDYQRIQFTPDVMPADIVGFSVYKPEIGSLEYQKGGAMTNLLLADEINRTSPKTQSALLEAMEEGKITVDGITRELPQPYVVIATQNPIGSIGTHSLPESQMDRFMIRISMGYPDYESEVSMLKQGRVNVAIDQIIEKITAEELIEIRQEVEEIYVHEDIYRYIVTLANATRNSRNLDLGLSPRGTIALLRMAKANAYLSNRTYLIPEDIKQVFFVTAGHRVIKSKEAKIQRKVNGDILKEIMKSVPLPKGNQ